MMPLPYIPCEGVVCTKCIKSGPLLSSFLSFSVRVSK